jgi:hypothetical protein
VLKRLRENDEKNKIHYFFTNDKKNVLQQSSSGGWDRRVAHAA